jgi:hypothetical protein
MGRRKYRSKEKIPEGKEDKERGETADGGLCEQENSDDESSERCEKEDK